jgi:outer membrane protein assembly factor BamB
MSSRTGRLVGLLGIVAGLLVLATLHDVSAQPGPLRPLGKTVGKTDEDKAFTDAVTVPTNSASKRLIQAAQDYIKKKEWRVTCECLQSLLEDKQDSFIEIDGGVDDKGKPAKRRVSVRTEANRLIGELPADGLETYQVMYGQAASDALKSALDTNDPALLAEVALRYLHTKPGADATNLLGTYHLDRGSYLMASLSFERLLSRPDADKLPVKVLFKAALAFRRAGDTANAEKVWKKMAEKAGRGDLVFGNRKVTLEQVRQEFEKAAAVLAQAGLNDWQVFRGNAARNAQGVGGTAYLEARWQYSMTPLDESDPTRPRDQVDATDQVRKLLTVAFARLEGKPILPAFFPVAANGKLIFRTYDGVHAVSLRDTETADGKYKAGELLWRSIPAQGGLHAMLARADKRMTVVENWYNTYYSHQGMGPAGVMFENSTVGSLSHDGQRVYFVDDLTIPPHPGLIASANFGNHVSFAPFTDEVHFSRLTAVELETGRQVWSIGERATTPPKDADEKKTSPVAGEELKDTFFLGPPLPLGGKLYLLVEKNTELRLVCLDPAKIVTYADNKRSPELVWQQSLGTANFRLPQDSLRRLQAAHLAYADGVIVCPTNAGVVLGVDLLSHSLVWAHSYRDGAQQPMTDEMQIMMQRGRFRGGVPMGGSPTQERWRPAAPIIQNGKVVFTAFDGDGGALHCLNLRDGRLIWNLKREDDDLYLGGVFGTRVVIVGKSRIRALNLDDGKELWKLPTGMPSGQGAASEDIYYLPLQWVADDADKRPGVLAINLATGKPIGPPARSRKKETLGNLLFADGELVSQTALSVSAFPELKRMLAEIDRRLKENPTDPIGLTERGELYLDKGDLPRAVEDLRTALANKPPTDIRGKARTKLHEALTDLLKNNFPAGEKYLNEYKDLCKIEIPDDADAVAKAKLADEQLRREVNYLSLLGGGREQQGRLLDAFAAYEQFGTLTGNKELVGVIDEPNTKSRPDVWSRGRIKGMIDKASPEQRKQLDEAIAKRWQAVRDGGDVDAVRRFVSLFGTHSQVGREAQLQLAERLLAVGGPDDLTEAETKLQGLCFAPEVRRQDPSTAAKAVEAMIRVYLKRGLYEDAVGFYKQLGTEFANVKVRDDKTGAELLSELFTDKRFLPYLEPLGIQWKGAFRSQETHPAAGSSFQPTVTAISIEPEGDDLLPFFRRNRLVLDVTNGGTPSWTLRMLDRESGEERWRQPGLPVAPYILQASPQPRFAFVTGHTLVLHLNHMVYAFNLAEQKEIWKYPLTGKSGVLFNPAQSPIHLDSDSRVIVNYPDGRKEKLGGIGLVSSSYVALLTRDGLVALDPSRPGPSVLWTKSDVPQRAQLFGDDEHVYVVEPGTDATPASVRALRAQDGVSVPVPDFGRLYARRIRSFGRCLLLQEDDPKAGKSIRLYDVQTGQNVWQRPFTAGAVVVQSQDPELTGVIEKDNSVTLLEARTGKLLFKSLIQPEHADKLEAAALIGDRDHFYLALSRKATADVMSWSPSASYGIRSLKMNGPLYALSRSTGKLEWVCDFLPYQHLLLEQVQDLPILLFAGKYHKSANGFDRQMDRVTSVDKRTGKLIYDHEFTSNVQFHALKIDARKGLIELIRQDLKISMLIDNGQSVQAGPVGEQSVPDSGRGRVILR